jgi:hypothetical protein
MMKADWERSGDQCYTQVAWIIITTDHDCAGYSYTVLKHTIITTDHHRAVYADTVLKHRRMAEHYTGENVWSNVGIP